MEKTVIHRDSSGHEAYETIDQATAEDIYVPDGHVLQKKLLVDTNHVLGEGGHGIAYSGVLVKGRRRLPCAIKLSKILKAEELVGFDGNNDNVRHSTGEIPTNYQHLMSHRRLKARESDDVENELRDLKREVSYGLILLMGHGMAKTLMNAKHVIHADVVDRAISEMKTLQNKSGYKFLHHILEFDIFYIPCIVSEQCDNSILTLDGKVNGSRKVTPLFEADGNVTPLWTQAASSVQKGLLYMHSMKIAHNDLKPDNIFYKKTRDGYHFFISDFGACTATDYVGRVQGTKGYYSSEQGLLQKGQATTAPIVKYNDAYAFAKTCLGLPYLHLTGEKLQGKKLQDYDITNDILYNPQSKWPLVKGLGGMLNICRAPTAEIRYDIFKNPQLLSDSTQVTETRPTSRPASSRTSSRVSGPSPFRRSGP
jgi:serine/threonine protein kinase